MAGIGSLALVMGMVRDKWSSLALTGAIIAGAISGCLSESRTGPESETRTPTVPPQPLGPTRANFTACTSLAAFRLVTFEHANDQLPAGFEAEDAGRYVSPDAGAEVGRALVALVGLGCDALDAGPGPMRFATLLVYIKPPATQGVALDPMPFDFYVIDLATDNATLADTAERYGMAVTRAKISHALNMAASGPNHEGAGMGDAALEDAEGALTAYTVAAGAHRERTFLIRGWHAGEKAIAAWDLVFDPEKAWVLIGDLTECSMRPGSPHARVFGEASCGQDATGSIIAEPQVIRSTFQVVVPGAV